MKTDYFYSETKELRLHKKSWKELRGTLLAFLWIIFVFGMHVLNLPRYNAIVHFATSLSIFIIATVILGVLIIQFNTIYASRKQDKPIYATLCTSIAVDIFLNEQDYRTVYKNGEYVVILTGDNESIELFCQRYPLAKDRKKILKKMFKGERI